jgi:transcriptional regulator with XRE-family HTH domain
MDDFNLRFGKRIKQLREKKDISQQELAELLHVPRSTISQIENGGRKLCAEELTRLSEIFQVSSDILLDITKEPEVILESVLPAGREDAKMSTSKSQMRINVPQKNMEKFKEVLLYILTNVGGKPNIGETVIYKLLYFIDFNFYEKYEEQLIGATYIKNRFGPTPVEFAKIVAKMIKDKEIEKGDDKYYDRQQKRYRALREPNLSKLRADEIKVIDEILNSKLSDMNATQISDYSHNDVPWLTTPEGKAIEYESVFYRTAPYSVRKYN